MAAAAPRARVLDAEQAFNLISSDQRIHPIRKGQPIIAGPTYQSRVHGFSDLDAGSTTLMKKEAFSRGKANIQRLSGYSDKQLNAEIQGLRDLATRQRAVIAKHYGSGLADDFERRGMGLAAGGGASGYRTSKKALYESAGGKQVEATGYDEFAQTSIVMSRSSGRRSALADYQKSSSATPGTLAKLNEIHQLMSITSSYVRGDTAGIASEHNDDPMGTRAQHPTQTSMRAKGGGSNSTYIHRLRTGVMQHAESAFIAEKRAYRQTPLMADIQRARLDAATLSTTHMFNSPPTMYTFSAMRAEVPAKMLAISGSREVAKDMREYGLAPIVSKTAKPSAAIRASFLRPPPSPRRTAD